MHTISIQASSNGYRWKCSCGQFGNEYGTEQHAREVGLRHKQYAEEEKVTERMRMPLAFRLGAILLSPVLLFRPSGTCRGDEKARLLLLFKKPGHQLGKLHGCL